MGIKVTERVHELIIEAFRDKSFRRKVGYNWDYEGVASMKKERRNVSVDILFKDSVRSAVILGLLDTEPELVSHVRYGVLNALDDLLDAAEIVLKWTQKNTKVRYRKANIFLDYGVTGYNPGDYVDIKLTLSGPDGFFSIKLSSTVVKPGTFKFNMIFTNADKKTRKRFRFSTDKLGDVLERRIKPKKYDFYDIYKPFLKSFEIINELVFSRGD